MHVDEYLRIATLLILLLPLAVQDWRYRTVSTDLLYVTVGISACFFAYDIITGRILNAGHASMLGLYVGIISAGALWAMSRIGRIGSADWMLALACVVMLPNIQGTAAGTLIFLVAMMLGAAHTMMQTLYVNLSDMASGRPFSRNFILSHMKRRGQRNTWAGTCGGQPINDDSIGADGSIKCEDKDSEGHEVHFTTPVATMCLVSCMLVASFLILTDFGADHVEALLKDGIHGLVSEPISIRLGLK